jgi:hypothetical protein
VWKTFVYKLTRSLKRESIAEFSESADESFVEIEIIVERLRPVFIANLWRHVAKGKQWGIHQLVRSHEAFRR